MSLTETNKKELTRAILEFLKSNGYENSYQELLAEAKVSPSDVSTDNILGRKWVLIPKLQMKIQELERMLEQAQKEAGAAGKLRILGKNAASENLPQMPEKMVLEGHRGQITSVLFHPIYSLLVSASEDATIRVWDIETGKPEKFLTGHTGTVNNLAFNTNGTMLASCSADISIKLWSFQTFDCIKTLQGHEHNITGIAFLPSGDHIVSSSRDKTIKLWEVASGYCLKTFVGHNEWVRKVIIHPTLVMASCSHDQTAIIWDLNDALTAIRNKTAGNDAKLILQQLPGHDNVIEAIAFGNDEANRVIEGSEYYRKARFMASISAGEETKDSIDASKAEVKKASKLFVATGARDKLIKLWDAKEATLVATFVGHDNWVRDILFHPNGKYLLSVSDDKSLRVWDLGNGRCIKQILNAHEHFVSCLDFTAKYLACATGSANKQIKVWDCS
eukprot:TRINITY_DN471_c0_g1_i1.p1 TRINITY_DN471_c0_g1~~TRINITY_DN471_c0_g1_i1.p1  ORF type:complete len:446 (-),score=116.19 TRINITY_DN471_c0_g1_i1:132-1469(-)